MIRAFMTVTVRSRPRRQSFPSKTPGGQPFEFNEVELLDSDYNKFSARLPESYDAALYEPDARLEMAVDVKAFGGRLSVEVHTATPVAAAKPRPVVAAAS